jgi:hypothetical protein
MIQKEVEAYRKRAQQCRSAAEKAADTRTQAYWLEAEKRWLSLAKTVERMATKRTVAPLKNLLASTTNPR